MTPTLFGRLQTRWFMVATFGVVWTLIVWPLLPRPDGATLGDVGSDLAQAIVLVAVLGTFWELAACGCLQWLKFEQLRWEKDWPSLFALLTGINEGLLLWAVLDMPTSTFWWHFTTTWIVIWLAAHGPMRVLFLKWRFRGGRLL